MFTDTDSETYATFTVSGSDTKSVTFELNGFDFSQIPANTPVTGFAVKLKAQGTGFKSYNNSAFKFSDLGGANYISKTVRIGGDANVITYENVTASDGTPITWETVLNRLHYPDIPAIYVYVGMNNASELKIYGAEIDVYGWVADTHGIFNMLLSGEGNYPVPVTEYTISRYPSSYTTSGTIKGTMYQSAIGKGADTETVSGNDYAPSNQTSYIYYSFDFSDVPDTAVITSMELKVKGHAESTSQSSNSKAQLLVYSNNSGDGSVSETAKSFTSTSAQTLTINFTHTWTVKQLKDAKLQFAIGYYGGLVNGATWTVTYEA